MDNNFIKFKNTYVPVQDEIKRNIINSEEFKRYYESEIQRRQEEQVASNTNIRTREAYLRDLMAIQEAGGSSVVNQISNVTNVNNVSNVSNVRNTNNISNNINNITNTSNFNEFITSVSNVNNNVNNTLNYSNTNNVMSTGNGVGNALDTNTRTVMRRTAINIDTKSGFINKDEYPNTNNFRIFLGKTFYNIRSIELLKIELPNTSPVINTDNNKIYWINQEDIELGIVNTVTGTYPVYSITLTPGSYSSESLETEIRTRMNQIKRKNGTGDYHYFDVSLNRETNVVEFISQTIQYLNNNPFASVDDSGVVTVTATGHGFSTGDTVFIYGAFSFSGLPSAEVNGEHTVVQVINSNSFTIELQTKAIATTSGGGNLVRIGKLAPFQLQFGSETDVIANNIGFLKENSSERIKTAVDFIKNTNLISVRTVSPHGLTLSDVGKYIDISDSSTIPDIDTDRTGYYNQIVYIVSPDTILIMSYDFNLSTATTSTTIASSSTTANEIIFSNSASSINDYYLGWFLKSDNEIRQITSYTGSNKKATVDEIWNNDDTILTSQNYKTFDNVFSKNVHLSDEKIYIGTDTFLNISGGNVNNSSGNILIYNVSGLTTTPNTTLTASTSNIVKFPIVNLFSNTQGNNGLIYSASDIYNLNPYKAFDGNFNTEWLSGNSYSSDTVPSSITYNRLIYTGTTGTVSDTGTLGGDWLQIDLGQQIVLKSFSIRPSLSLYTIASPSTFYLVAGNNGSTWSTLYTAGNINWTSSEKEFTVTNSTMYRYYRLIVNVIGNDFQYFLVSPACRLSEWKLNGQVAQDSFSFGKSLAVPYSNEEIVIGGAPYASFLGSVGASAGSIFKYTYTGSSWTETRINSPLTSFSNGNSSFGFSLSTNLHGDFILVGAPDRDSGYAFVYYSDNSFFNVSNTDINSGDEFGRSVCSSNISGNTMQNRFVISAPNHDSLSGAVYVYDNTRYNFTKTDYNFGSSAAISGDNNWLIVGNGYSTKTDSTNTIGSLSIYRNIGGWEEIPFQEGFIINNEYIPNSMIGLNTSGSSTELGYGYSLAINSGNFPTIVISSYVRNSSGTLRIITYDETISAYAPTTFGNIGIGHSVVMSEALLGTRGNLLIATSAPYESSTPSVYTYYRNNPTSSNYSLQTQLTGGTGTAFGAGLSTTTDGQFLFVSAYADNNSIGSVYIKQNTGGNSGTWQNVQTLTGTVTNGYFGWSIGCSGNGDRLVVSELSTRTVYLYERSGPTWGSTFFTSKDVTLFGNSVSMSRDGNSFIVTTGDISSPILYRWMGTYWQETAIVENPNNNVYQSVFSSLNNIVLHNASSNDVDIYNFDYSNFVTLTSTSVASGHLFGSAVSITPNGQTLAVSSPGYNNGKGAIYVYNGSLELSHIVPLINSQTGENPGLYNNISINEHGTIIFVGSEQSSLPDTPTNKGKVYELILVDNSWVENVLESNDGDFYGKAVSVKGKNSLVASLQSSGSLYRDKFTYNLNSFPNIGDDILLYEYPSQTELSFGITRSIGIEPNFTYKRRQYEIESIENSDTRYIDVKTDIIHGFSSTFDNNTDIILFDTSTLTNIDGVQTIRSVYNSKNFLITGSLNTESTTGSVSRKNPLKSNIRYITAATTGVTTTFSTNTAHKLEVGDSVQFFNISSLPRTLENEILTVTNVPSSTTFTVNFITGLVNINSNSYIGYGLLEMEFSNHGFNRITSITNGSAPGEIILNTFLPNDIILNESKSINETNSNPTIDDVYKIVNIIDTDTFGIYYTDNLISSILVNQTSGNNTIVFPATVGSTNYTDYFIKMLSGDFNGLYGIITSYTTGNRTGIINGPLGENILLGQNTSVTIGNTGASIKNLFGSYIKLSQDRTTLFTADGDINGSNIKVYKNLLGTNNWILNSTIPITDTSFNPLYSYSWSIDCNTAGTSFIVGDATALNFAGNSLLFEWDGSEWVKTIQTQSTTGVFNGFGVGVAMSGDGTIVASGAWNHLDSGQDEEGAVFVYRKTGGTWGSPTTIKETSSSQMYFGQAIDMGNDGKYLFVGASLGNPNNGYSSGSVYLYEWSGSAWGSATVIEPPTPTIGDDFGIDLSCSEDGEKVVIYSSLPNDEIYFSKWNSTSSTWDQTIITSASTALNFNGNIPSLSNNVSMSRDGNTFVMIRENSSVQSVYKYVFDNSTWTESLVLSATSENIKFQVSMIDENYFLIGQLEYDPDTNSYDTTSKNVILYVGKNIDLGDRFVLYSYEESFTDTLQEQVNYQEQYLDKIIVSSLLYTNITKDNLIQFSSGTNDSLILEIESSFTSGNFFTTIELNENLNGFPLKNDTFSHWYINETHPSTSLTTTVGSIVDNTSGSLLTNVTSGDLVMFPSVTIGSSTYSNLVASIYYIDGSTYYYNTLLAGVGNIFTNVVGDFKFFKTQGVDVLPEQQYPLALNQVVISNELSTENKGLVTNGNYLMFTSGTNNNLIRTINSTQLDAFGNIVVTLNLNLNGLSQLGDTYRLYGQVLRESGTNGYIESNNDFYVYNVSDVGGVDNSVINNVKHTIREILDENRFLFYVNGFSDSEQYGGGSETYISSLIHGFSGEQSNLRVNQVQRAITLEGENYVFICCPQLDTLLNTTDVTNIFARVSLENRPGSVAFSNVNNYISYPKEFIEAPLPKLEDIEIAVRKWNGDFYNINNLDWSMVLLVSEELVMDQTFNFSSKSGLNIGM